MAGNPLTDPNWAENTTEQVVRVVDQVKAKTTKPAVMAARGLVFGLMSVFLALFALVILLVGLTRGIQVLLELGLSKGRSVYLSYLIVGALLCLVGAVLFKKRNQTADPTVR